MFRTDLLPIVRSLVIVFTTIGICHTDCLLARSVADSQHSSMTNTNCCEYSIKTPNDGQEVYPEHVEFFIEMKLRNSASFGFISTNTYIHKYMYS